MNPYVDAIFPALVVFSIACLIFGFAAFKQYLKHKERVEALESIIVRDEYELNQKFKAL